MSEVRASIPPNSLEAERSVLGAMLQDARAVDKAMETLAEEDFYQPQHKEIYRCMQALHQQHHPIDLITMDAELARRGSLEGIGGDAYLMELEGLNEIRYTKSTHMIPGTLQALNRPSLVAQW